MKTWRDKAKKIIAHVLEENKGKSEQEIKKAIREAYPFGDRKYHPYQVWLDEVKIQTGRKKRKIRGEVEDKNQLSI